MREVLGTAQSVGCTVDGEDPHDLIEQIQVVMMTALERIYVVPKQGFSGKTCGTIQIKADKPQDGDFECPDE